MPVAILGSHFIQPATFKTHEVMKSTAWPVESVIQKSRISRRLRMNLWCAVTQLLQHQRKHQRAGVIIGAITFGEIRNRKTGVLKYAGSVAHSKQMIQL